MMVVLCIVCIALYRFAAYMSQLISAIVFNNDCVVFCLCCAIWFYAFIAPNYEWFFPINIYHQLICLSRYSGGHDGTYRNVMSLTCLLFGVVCISVNYWNRFWVVNHLVESYSASSSAAIFSFASLSNSSLPWESWCPCAHAAAVDLYGAFEW